MSRSQSVGVAVAVLLAGTPARAADPAPIGDRVQLFVDDGLIASKEGVRRTLHPAERLAKPVLEPEHPWEGRRALVYGTVLRDPASGRFRMWYHGRVDDPKAHHCPGLERPDLVLYAESEDGVRWEKPKLGLFSFDGSKENNIVSLTLHCPCVVLDERAKPEERYKLLGSRAVRGGFHAAVSADGIRWKAVGDRPVIPFGSELVSASWDPVAGHFLACFRTEVPQLKVDGVRGKRTISATTSKDFRAWSEPKVVLTPDAKDDHWVEKPGQRSELHDLSAFRYGSHVLGLVTDFRVTGTVDKPKPDQARWDGPMDVQLAYSRDGTAWHRPDDRTPVIPRGKPGAFDGGCVIGKASGPVVHDDQVWVYYTGMNTTLAGTLEEKRLCIGRAAWRLDGFVSLDAGRDPGVVRTHPLKPDGDRLTVNADAAGGRVAVAVLGADGRPVKGYAEADCRAIRTDDVRHAVRWAGGDGLPPGAVSLRFHLQDAKLYSFRVGKAPPK